MATGSPVSAGGDLDRKGKLPLIAVIAVHGVADQAPNESARQIAELLLRNRHDGGAAKYSSFREYPLRIPVDQPLDNCPDQTCPVDARMTRDADGGSSVVDLDFTHFLLHRYKTKHAPYETVRLEGHRLREPAPAQDQSAWIERDQCHVHVYELFWADLSRLGTGLVGFVGAIYQLISSLAHLGIRTIRQARQREDPRNRSKLWSSYFRIHDIATWLLTVVVPFLNLAILGAALAMLVARIPRGLQALLIAALMVVLLVVARTRWRLHAGVKVPDNNTRAPTNKASALLRSMWSMGPSFIWLAIAAVVAFFLHQYLTRPANDVAALRLTVIVWIAVMVFLLVTLGRIYRERISSALLVSILVSGATAVVLLVFTLGSRDVVQMSHGAVRTIELLFFLLTAVWIFVTLGGIGSAIAAALVAGFASTDRKSVLRAMWTGASTFAVSTASMSALALLVWSALYAVLAAALPAPSPYSLRPVPAASAYDPAWQPPAVRVVTRDTSYAYTSRVRHVLLADQAQQVCFDPKATVENPARSAGRVVECRNFSLKSILRTLLSISAMTGLFINGIALGLTAVIGLWLAFPSIIRELQPAGDPERTERNASMAAGLWLTQGFRQLRRAAVGVYGLVFVGTGFVIALALWIFRQGAASDGWYVSVFEFIQPYSDAFVFGIGSLVAASTVGVLALLSRFGRLANMFRPVLDVSLDVDNYLKSRPVRRTPRARMMERFVSLLRYITRWRRNGFGYDAIIVVAHSQGTVLTSDLLRYQAAPGRQFKDLSLTQGYRWQKEPGVHVPAPLAVDFFTMGSPLRQLYTSSFPHLFHWTGLTPDNDDAARQLCDSLGVRRWWNVFRSGDYVGRALWQYGGAASAYIPGEVHTKGDVCREVCLGLGAHTHYWDESAGDDVAVALDNMVELAHEESPRKR